MMWFREPENSGIPVEPEEARISTETLEKKDLGRVDYEYIVHQREEREDPPP